MDVIRTARLDLVSLAPEFLTASLAADRARQEAILGALARGLGFERAGSHIDDEDGPEDVFRRDIATQEVP